MFSAYLHVSHLLSGKAMDVRNGCINRRQIFCCLVVIMSTFLLTTILYEYQHTPHAFRVLQQDAGNLTSRSEQDYSLVLTAYVYPGLSPSAAPAVTLLPRPIIFIKTHKCASSTIQNILMRYGIKHRLRFAIPQSGAINRLGWPNAFDPSQHVKNYKDRPDLICYHSVFSNAMLDYMPPNSFYLTAVRNPYDQIRSSYNYFNIYKCSGLTLNEHLRLTLQEPLENARMCGVIALNPVMYDLGMNFSQMMEDDAIDRHLQLIDRHFHLVIVVDYLDESLILLRDMLGWSMEDILSFSVNFVQLSALDHRDRSYICNEDAHDEAIGRVLASSALRADTKLYIHFKSKLERFLSAKKEYIHGEKQKLQDLRKTWMDYCVNDVVPAKEIPDIRFQTFGNGAYGYNLTKAGLKNQTCIDLTMAEIPFVKRVAKFMSLP